MHFLSFLRLIYEQTIISTTLNQTHTLRMKNTLPSSCQPMFATILSMALLLFLPLMYSFHYVVAKTDKHTKQEQVKTIEEQDTLSTALKPFKFNLNTISEEELNQLGLPEKAIKNILMFRKKGGTFRKTNDLNKIYGITNATFEKLQPYIQL